MIPPSTRSKTTDGCSLNPQLWRPIANSVSMALIATAANVVVCFVAAYLIVLRQFSGRRLLEVLVALPWAIPATAIALGLAATFNETTSRRRESSLSERSGYFRSPTSSVTYLWSLRQSKVHSGRWIHRSRMRRADWVRRGG